MKPLLAKLCRLEKQDASLFLPFGFLDTLTGARQGHVDPTRTRFHANLNDESREKYSSTTLILPATLRMTHTNQRQWTVFGPPHNVIDDEMMFFGELYVSLTWRNQRPEQVGLRTMFLTSTRYQDSWRCTLGTSTYPKRTGLAGCVPELVSGHTRRKQTTLLHSLSKTSRSFSGSSWPRKD